MGREVKRVPMDFDWPMGVVWRGYRCPYRATKCHACDGHGSGPRVRELSKGWYDFERTGRRWCDAITQDEVDALIESGRLYDFTSKIVPGKGWERIEGRVVTAEEVNAAVRAGRSMHDAINKSICVEQRARRLGVWDSDGECRTCGGHGDYYCDESYRQLANNWQAIEPPTGEAWQMWETTSEGSPISPPCVSPEALARWLSENAASALGSEAATYDQWLAMIRARWAPSAVSFSGRVMSGVAAATATPPAPEVSR